MHEHIEGIFAESSDGLADKSQILKRTAAQADTV